MGCYPNALVLVCADTGDYVGEYYVYSRYALAWFAVLLLQSVIELLQTCTHIPEHIWFQGLVLVLDGDSRAS